MLPITLKIDLFDSRKIDYSVPSHQRSEADRRMSLEQFARRASSLRRWSRAREKVNSGSIAYEVSRPGCAVASVLVTFRDHDSGAPPSIEIAGNFEGRASLDVEELGEQLRFVLGLDYDWIACDAALQSLCATLFMGPASSASVSIKSVDACYRSS